MMKRSTRAIGAVLLCAAAVSALAAPAIAQSPAELQRELQQRDATIQELQRRLDQVMTRLDALERGAAPRPASPPPPTAAVPAAPPPAATAQIPPPARSTPAPAPAPSVAVTTPSDEEIGRALETTLLRRRAMVLPPWAFEMTPGISYSNSRTNSTTFVTTANGLGITTQDVRNDLYAGSVLMRLGLPWDSQAEVLFPFGYEDQRVITGGVSQSSNLAGIGDVQVALSKQLFYERDWVPGLLGIVEYKSSTGRVQNASTSTATANTFSPTAGLTTLPPLALGTGFDTFAAGFTATKRQDPLVYFGSASYAVTLPNTIGGANIHPSDSVGIALGAALATSPTTSVSADFAVGFSGENKVNGVKVAGTDQVIGIFQLGAATVLTPRSVLDVGLGFGVTSNAPNFIMSVSVPYRF